MLRSSSLSASGVKDGDLIVLERAGGQNSSLAHPANGIAGGCAPLPPRPSPHLALKMNLCYPYLQFQAEPLQLRDPPIQPTLLMSLFPLPGWRPDLAAVRLIGSLLRQPWSSQRIHMLCQTFFARRGS